jgi:formate-dependent phosphoribosylglycinamide formyltransferase (GAR transformylase)
MHVLFLAPDTHVYNHGVLLALKALGARVSAIGPTPPERLSPPARRLLDGYRACPRMLDAAALLEAARALATPHAVERVETIDEPLIEPAATLRGALGVPGLPAATARLCRDKVAMKDFLRRHGVPCAESTGAGSEAEVRAFAERCGYPLIVKPVAGYGSLDTYRVDDAGQLGAVLRRVGLGDGRRVAVEEFITGHEGFFDTITDGHGVRFDFAAHYYPGCLEAAQHRWISPQIAVTNRIDGGGYDELRQLGRRVVDLLGLRHCATHMEWFFGPKGLKFSEIGARPAGEKIWDMYRVGNEFDVFREWALALVGHPAAQQPSRRFAVGSVQIRPSQDGRIDSYRGLDAALRHVREWLYEYDAPAPGTPTQPLTKGWLVNLWFRLRHPDYDELRRLMTYLGESVQCLAK